jgi:epoxyqueuosine reductase
LGIKSHDVISDLLPDLGVKLALKLQDDGYGSVHFHASDIDLYGLRYLQGKLKPYHYLFSHRHSAVRAGLGEFGLDNIVVTPEYGQRIRFNSVLTTAELNPTPLITKKVCLGTKCGKCLRECVHLGVIKHDPELEKSKVWYDPVYRTVLEKSEQNWNANYCLESCASACPIGKRA